MKVTLGSLKVVIFLIVTSQNNLTLVPQAAILNGSQGKLSLNKINSYNQCLNTRIHTLIKLPVY